LDLGLDCILWIVTAEVRLVNGKLAVPSTGPVIQRIVAIALWMCLHWVAADATLLWAKRAHYESLDYTREQYVGHHMAEFHADPADCDELLRRLGQGEMLYNYGVLLRHKNCSAQHMLIACSGLIDLSFLAISKLIMRKPSKISRQRVV
jgi:hypothetical protein